VTPARRPVSPPWRSRSSSRVEQPVEPVHESRDRPVRPVRLPAGHDRRWWRQIGELLRFCRGGRQETLPGEVDTGLEPRSEGERVRSEEHTSELQSRENLVCRLLLEKKNENYA